MTRSIRKLAMIAASLLLSASVSLSQPVKEQKLIGVISDTMCGAKHMMQGSAAECTRACVGKGSKYALVVGEKVYTLSGHEDELDKVAGQRATITGTVDGATVNVSAVHGP
jgi:hypothetical protein